MKFPSHILLDIYKKKNLYLSKYWIFRYIYCLEKDLFFFNTLSFHKNYKNFNYKNNSYKYFFNKFNTNFFNKFNYLFLFDINFIKKEKIYTKLKYSRVPQYDIVSGGSAAIFAGFLGFLICEKFGFELLDSGDFYFLFMYIVFLSFFLKLYVKIISTTNNSWNILSLKSIFFFYKNIIFMFINFLKKN